LALAMTLWPWRQKPIPAPPKASIFKNCRLKRKVVIVKLLNLRAY
jgi:hypothetical protein